MLPGPAPTALGHRRLSIIDLSACGAQPMGAPCAACGSTGVEQLALTYNGEIYNFAELRRELEAQGHAFHSRTDTEVLLHLYARDGLRMVERLNGIFAFALYDGRPSGRPDGVEPGDLLVVRDGMGVKPLYYAQLPQGLLFASEIKALAASGVLPREIDEVALHQTLAYLWTPAPRTLLRHVRKLPPGGALLVRGGRIAREWRFYDLPYGQPPLEEPADEVARRVHALVRQAVERQMVSDVPVGAFLSGGLDSSAVVAMMRRVHPGQRPPCYTIGFEGDSLDGSPADLPYARRVAEHLGVPLREIVVGSGMVRDLERMLWALDEPQADPAPINALLIAEQARRDGVPVLMSGTGGDDVFSGYRRHRALRAERLWGWLPAAARGALGHSARALSAGGGLLHAAPVRRAAKAFAYAGLPADRRLVSYFWWSGDALRRALYSGDLAARVGGADVAEPLLESLSRVPRERDPLNRMLYLEGKHFLADHNLNYTDKVGMASGIEVRVPLLDPDLVAYAARIPARFKQHGATGKWIFKRAMEGELPRDVVYRPKTGFGAPLRHWMRNDLRDYVEDTLSPGSLRRRGLFDPAAVGALVQADRAGRVDGAYTLFALMCVELWCRMFVDADAAHP
jgi:asparagine synthase (glutamine-hydrolysing)